MLGGFESLRASGKFASPRESGERSTREARRERGTAERERASAPLPSPLPAFAGRGNRTVPGRRNSWISRQSQTVRCPSAPRRGDLRSPSVGRATLAVARSAHGNTRWWPSVPRMSAVAYEGAGRPGPHLIQSSNTTPGTRANSDMLLVTTIKRLATAMAAIIKSRSPMGWPLAAKWARAWA